MACLHQAMTWTSDEAIGTLGTNVCDISIKIHNFVFKKMHVKHVVYEMVAISSRASVC